MLFYVLFFLFAVVVPLLLAIPGFFAAADVERNRQWKNKRHLPW